MTPRSVILASAFLPLLAMPLHAQEGDGPDVASLAPALTLSHGLIATVEEDLKVALRPLRGPDSNVTERLARDLYEAMLDGLFQASGGRHTIMTRERLLQVYETCEEFFSCGDMTARLAAARADVEVQCVASPGPNFVRLSCSAVQIETTVTVGRGSADFPLTAFAQGQDWQNAIADIAAQLNTGIEAPGNMGSVALIDQRTGTSTVFATMLGNKLRFELGRRMTQRRTADINEARARIQLGHEEAALPDFPSYGLHGVLWQAGEDRVTLTVEARFNGRTVAMSSADIAATTIPEHLQIEIAGPEAAIEATAEAVVSARLDPDSARRAAMNLARARVIAQALGVAAPALGSIATEADATRALGEALRHGIPYDERVETLGLEGGDRVVIRLTARVKPVAQREEPVLDAALNQPVFETGEAIRLTLSGTRDAHIGLFAWGADNRVVRVYPVPGIPAPRLVGNTPIHLPEAAEDRSFQSAPLPLTGIDNPEDHEMFLVVASRTPLDWESLAPPLGASVEETMANARTGEAFLQALSERDLSRATIRALPYQIRE